MAKKDAAPKKESERAKAAGQTEAQKALADYHRGDFQTTDPVTGEPRGKTGGNWQTQEDFDEYEATLAAAADVDEEDAPKKARKPAKNDEPDFTEK